MRGFLILLALVFPATLVNPWFWTLVATQWGVLESTLTHHDGTVQRAQAGPLASWPDWATVPDGAALRVEAWYVETPSQPGTGFADLSFRGPAPANALAYADKLRGEGWTVETAMVSAMLPTIPRREEVRCDVRARRTNDPRVLVASFEVEPRPGKGRIHWATRPMPYWSAPAGKPC